MSKTSEIWNKLKSKGDAVIAAFLAAVVLRRFEGNDQAAEEVGKAAAAFAEKFFEGEHNLESLAVLKAVLSPESWERSVTYFDAHPSDSREQAIGQMWRAVRNKVTYHKLDQDGKLTEHNVADPLEMFKDLFENTFRPDRTDNQIHAQLERLYQASTWHRLAQRLGSVVTPRTLRNICFGIGATVVLFVAAVALLFFMTLPLFVGALYGLIISPLGGVGDLIAAALLLGILLLIASPAPLLAMRFFGIRPARKTYLRFARNAFLLGIFLRFVIGLPELIRIGSSQAHEIEVAGNTVGGIFTEDGTPLRCRPTGDLEDEEWLPFVYTCDGNNPGYSTQSGEPGRGLTPAEARKWLSWKEEQKEEETERKTESNKLLPIAKPIHEFSRPDLRDGLRAMMDEESFMEQIYEMGYTEEQVGSIIILAPENGWSDPIDIVEEMKEYFEESGGLKPQYAYFTYPISRGDLRVKDNGKEVELPEAGSKGLGLDWEPYSKFSIKAGRMDEWLVVICNGLPRRK